MGRDEQKTSAYGTAMNVLVERLRSVNAFACLKTAPLDNAGSFREVPHGDQDYPVVARVPLLGAAG